MIKDKGFWKILGTLVLSAITLPFVINFAYGWLLSTGWGTMYANNSDVWISFLGGFLGAGVTILGVYWQITMTQRKEKVDMISNTYATYKLLESNLEILIKNAYKAKGDIINYTKTNRTFKMEKGMLNYLEFTLGFKSSRDVIYNFINQSLPEEKTDLIKHTHNMAEVAFSLEKFINSISAETSLADIGRNMDDFIIKVRKDRSNLKKNKDNFKKNHNEDLKKLELLKGS